MGSLAYIMNIIISEQPQTIQGMANILNCLFQFYNNNNLNNDYCPEADYPYILSPFTCEMGGKDNIMRYSLSFYIGDNMNLGYGKNGFSLCFDNSKVWVELSDSDSDAHTIIVKLLEDVISDADTETVVSTVKQIINVIRHITNNN